MSLRSPWPARALLGDERRKIDTRKLAHGHRRPRDEALPDSHELRARDLADETYRPVLDADVDLGSRQQASADPDRGRDDDTTGSVDGSFHAINLPYRNHPRGRVG